MAKNKKIHLFDVRWKVAATLFVMFFFFIGGFSYFTHSLIRNHDTYEMREYLSKTLKLAAKNIDIAAHKKLVKIVQSKPLTSSEKIALVHSPEYTTITQYFHDIQAIDPEEYNSIYTLIPTGDPNTAKFVSDMDTLSDLTEMGKRPDWESWIVFPGNQYDISAQPITRQALRDKVTLVDTEVRYDPTWGVSSLMGFAPIIDPKTHEFLGLLGIDLYANNIDARDAEIHNVLNIITAIAIGSALIVTLIFTRIFLQVRRLTEAKEALEQSYEQLRELDVKKSEFLNIASHELRTPMTSVKGYSSMLLDGDAGELSSEAREYVRIIFNQSKRLVRLINDMLDISKIEAGKSEEFTLFPTEIKKALWQIRDDFISIASEKQISLIWDIDIPDSTVILLPTDRYRQAIINLIGNALKFTPQDGSVTLQASISKKWLTVNIIDTGMGISKKDQEVVFEKFGQAKASLRKEQDGTGLGLAIVKAIVERLRGEIILKSEEGKGSTFTINVPIIFQK